MTTASERPDDAETVKARLRAQWHHSATGWQLHYADARIVRCRSASISGGARCVGGGIIKGPPGKRGVCRLVGSGRVSW